MLKILQEISKRALLLNVYDFTEEQQQSKWIGEKPALDADIEAAEKLLRIQLPQDYINFLKITNGFPQYDAISVNFLSVNKIDYLINVDEDLVEIWKEAVEEVGEALSQSIIVGGIHEEQSFLLIPPNEKFSKWQYWMFANWNPGEQEFINLKDFFKYQLVSLRKDTKGLKKPKPKFVVDYSLRDFVFNYDWENTYKTALKFLQEDKSFIYFDGHVDLLEILLLAASKLNCFEVLKKDLFLLKSQFLNLEWLAIMIDKFEKAANLHLSYVDFYQRNNFVIQENPKNLIQIEEQIKEYRPDLMKPKNIKEKIDYQLYFLFESGNINEFIRLYELNIGQLISYKNYIKAAIIYATIDDFLKAQDAIKKYLDFSFKAASYYALEPFVNHILFNKVMTKEFSKECSNIYIHS
jgi:hypothetical protein